VSRGSLITVEGIDGAGKTTLVQGLLAAIEQRAACVQALREPGGVELSERIRALLADPSLRMAATTEALLYAAARAELVHARIAPLLQEGAYVLLDRFVDSSLAYQGAGRSLGIERIAAINALATGGLVPDRTLLLRVPSRLARERLGARGGMPERLEGEQEAFFQRVARAYERLAESEPGRVRTIDATPAPELVLERALAEIEDLLPPPGGARPR
jgi:dTMP kinase